MNKKISVLVIDDSAVVRNVLKEILESNYNIGEVETAADPFAAAEKIQKKKPDVITLDIEMPKMDGVTFLYKIMSQYPIPVVMCSSLTGEGCETTLKALEYGAVDIITKPKMGVKNFLEESQIMIIDSVIAASKAKLKILKQNNKIKNLKTDKYTADVVLPPPIRKAMFKTTEKIVAVGASTGGTEALRVFLESMPLDCPGIVIVQHMPENFTSAFAKRLNGICQIEIKEAENGDSILTGRALIAQGNKHLLVKRSGARYYVHVKEGPLVCRHRPSVDVLFRSVAQNAGKNAIGVIMTGMGDDGARGMLEMKEAGAYTIAQDEKSSVVFGMPHEAIQLNSVDEIVSLEKISSVVINMNKK